MKITYVEKGIPVDFKRIDTIKTIVVDYLAFKSGNLLYFRKNDFDYFVIDSECIKNIED